MNEPDHCPQSKIPTDTPNSLESFSGSEIGRYSAIDLGDCEFLLHIDRAGILASPCNPCEIRVTCFACTPETRRLALARREEFHRELDAPVSEAVHEFGDLPGGGEASGDLAVFDARLLKDEQIG